MAQAKTEPKEKKYRKTLPEQDKFMGNWDASIVKRRSKLVRLVNYALSVSYSSVSYLQALERRAPPLGQFFCFASSALSFFHVFCSLSEMQVHTQLKEEEEEERRRKRRGMHTWLCKRERKYTFTTDAREKSMFNWGEEGKKWALLILWVGHTQRKFIVWRDFLQVKCNTVNKLEFLCTLVP